jgi:hypothetical protein
MPAVSALQGQHWHSGRVTSFQIPTHHAVQFNAVLLCATTFVLILQQAVQLPPAWLKSISAIHVGLVWVVATPQNSCELMCHDSAAIIGESAIYLTPTSCCCNQGQSWGISTSSAATGAASTTTSHEEAASSAGQQRQHSPPELLVSEGIRNILKRGAMDWMLLILELASHDRAMHSILLDSSVLLDWIEV